MIHLKYQVVFNNINTYKPSTETAEMYTWLYKC